MFALSVILFSLSNSGDALYLVVTNNCLASLWVVMYLVVTSNCLASLWVVMYLVVTNNCLASLRVVMYLAKLVSNSKNYIIYVGTLVK